MYKFFHSIFSLAPAKVNISYDDTANKLILGGLTHFKATILTVFCIHYELFSSINQTNQEAFNRSKVYWDIFLIITRLPKPKVIVTDII